MLNNLLSIISSGLDGYYTKKSPEPDIPETFYKF